MKNLKDSYKNPFSDYSANGLDAETILNYWCSPFNFIPGQEIKESDLFTDKNPIVFMGGRGSGKTMFLKYFSYEVQKIKVQREVGNKDSLIEHLLKDEGIGFYLRIDGPVLRSFKNFDIKQEKWNAIFTHYFELEIAKKYMEVLNDLIKSDWIELNNITQDFFTSISKIFGTQNEFQSIDAVLDEIYSMLQEITDYRGAVPLTNNDFKPSKHFASQSLSFKIPEIANDFIPEFKGNTDFILLIDEYENFSQSQQRMVNTLLKFVRPGINFRLGMRLEGFRTYDTITSEDFIREGRDYRKIEFEDVLFKKEKKGYQDFLKGVAEKRLKEVPVFKEKNKNDITSFLGTKEDLEKEALELVKNDPDRHFKFFENHLPKNSTQILSYRENPLLELLNILWVLRGEKPEYVKVAMDEYLNDEKTDKAEKYKRDYVDKYKLSLIIILSSIYKKNKLYYSFNTFSFLSSGIIGYFIELCRRTFQYAEFENLDHLINEGEIKKEYQSKAAHDLAGTELEMIRRIETYGNRIYQFALNLGNIFEQYHKDYKIRYPETNQFSVEVATLKRETEKAFNTSLKWSVIQKKPSIQQSSPGKGKKDLYTLNRIFSPLFNISYRTRGGISEEYTGEDIEKLMTTDQARPKKDLESQINSDFYQRKLDL